MPHKEASSCFPLTRVCEVPIRFGVREEETLEASPFSCLFSSMACPRLAGLAEVVTESHIELCLGRDQQTPRVCTWVWSWPSFRCVGPGRGQWPACSVFRALVTLVLKHVVEMWPGWGAELRLK